MLDPTSLFTYESHIDPRTVHARTLVVSLTSFVDAGHAQRIVDDHLRNTLPSHRLGEFDADQVIAYREQRPMIVFGADHFEQYRTPALTLTQINDSAGESFLLLSGPEPGLQWERLAAAIGRIVDVHDVQLTVLLQSMPMPVPHTRPVLVSRWATRDELIPDNRPMFGTVMMSASFPAMLSQRLGERGHDVVGLTAHIPHYLAESDFPDAAIALLDALRTVSRLNVPTMQLAVAAGIVRAQLGHQVGQSEELAEHLGQLEESYDEFNRRRELAAAEEHLPSADEIGRAAEDFLKRLGGSDPDSPTGFGGPQVPRTEEGDQGDSDS